MILWLQAISTDVDINGMAQDSQLFGSARGSKGTVGREGDVPGLTELHKVRLDQVGV